MLHSRLTKAFRPLAENLGGADQGVAIPVAAPAMIGALPASRRKPTKPLLNSSDPEVCWLKA
jgi:hypothetical protein